MSPREKPGAFCLRCGGWLERLGGDAVGDGRELIHLSIESLTLDVYACRRCGQAEFFRRGVGEDLRSEPGRPAEVPVIPPPAEVEPGPEWVCGGCGENSPGTFEKCWNCGKARN